MVIEMIADLVCPWCYLGLKRLQRALAQRPGRRPRLVWRPFLLNPEAPPQGIPLPVYFGAATGGDPDRVIANVLRAAAPDAGLFDFPRIATVPNSIDAHRLVQWAGRQGHDEILQLRLIDALYRAYFGAGRDLADHAILAGIAGESGLDSTAARRHLDGEDDRVAVLKDHQRVRNLGIKGVPCFIVDGRYALSGAQEPEVFLPLLDLSPPAASA